MIMEHLHPASLSYNQHNNKLSYWLQIQLCTSVISLIFRSIYMIKSANTIILWPYLRYNSNTFLALTAIPLNIPFNIVKIDLTSFPVISKWKLYLSFAHLLLSLTTDMMHKSHTVSVSSNILSVNFFTGTRRYVATWLFYRNFCQQDIHSMVLQYSASSICIKNKWYISNWNNHHQ